MLMPEPNDRILSRKADIVARLQGVLSLDAVIYEPNETLVYECDALTA